jgi:uncharacterized membrane protein YagU involved in acid resistance
MMSVGEGNSAQGILWGGLSAGAMDISAAILTWKIKANAPPIRVLQSVASGWMGKDAFAGGAKTAALGLAFHFLIAFTAAAVFYLASKKIRFLLNSVWAAGVLYGVAVYGFMYWVVMPLSNVRRGPLSWEVTIIAIVTHIVCVGLPIALSVRKFSR